ncbi:Putative DNA-binding domain-containing protein [Ensifer adhaerens]|nr:Putative DNA-binding domain-containing protein [Ensifer adhaerens]
MAAESIEEIIGLDIRPDGSLKVNSRERRDLEFKQDCEENTLRSCLKTIAAFANNGGGRIVFGISDSPRHVVGVDPGRFPDEAIFDDFIRKYLSPVPDVIIEEHTLYGTDLVSVRVAAMTKPPVIAVRECQTSGKKNKTVLQPGVIYNRRAGKSECASSDEFRMMMERRDQAVQQAVLSIFDRARAIGFDRVSVADFSNFTSPGDNVTLYLPDDAARHLNVIDRARLVEDHGAPAYEIKGRIDLTTFSDKDPRKPMLPRPAARALKADVESALWRGVPWSEQHLRKAASQLGFWDKKEGDGVHTTVDELTKQPRYLERARIAVRDFARNNTDAFVDAICSRENKQIWKRKMAGRGSSSPVEQSPDVQILVNSDDIFTSEETADEVGSRY